MGVQVFLAYLVDLLAGDPPALPHPVVLIGKAIAALESLAGNRVNSPRGLKLAGAAIVFTVVAGSYVTVALLLSLLYLVSPVLSYLAGVWIISTTLATRGLGRVAGDIRRLLARERLTEARMQVGMVVGRDSGCMDKHDIARATVETVAENSVDAVVAPLFYAFIAGPPGAMAYRAVNTLDSMLGYKDDRYFHLGWAAAKLDDMINYVPARLTGLFMLAATWLTGRDTKGALRAVTRDARRHPSPNAGIPESLTAGALGIRLGGLNYYRGSSSFRAHMGSGRSRILPGDIRPAVDLMFMSSFLAALTGWLIHLHI